MAAFAGVLLSLSYEFCRSVLVTFTIFDPMLTIVDWESRVPFTETSLWLMFVAMFGVFGGYCYMLLPTAEINTTNSGVLSLIGAIVLIVMIAGHVAIAIFDRDAVLLGIY